MVVLKSGEIAVYSIEGEQRLLSKTDSNMLVMYQSPCFIFRWSAHFCNNHPPAVQGYFLLLQRSGVKLTCQGKLLAGQ